MTTVKTPAASSVTVACLPACLAGWSDLRKLMPIQDQVCLRSCLEPGQLGLGGKGPHRYPRVRDLEPALKAPRTSYPRSTEYVPQPKKQASKIVSLKA